MHNLEKQLLINEMPIDSYMGGIRIASLNSLFFFPCRFKASSVPGSVSKGVPDFCSVYVISKGKISSVRNATRPAPYSSPLQNHIQNLNKDIFKPVEPPKQKLSVRGLYFSILNYKPLKSLSILILSSNIILVLCICSIRKAIFQASQLAR